MLVLAFNDFKSLETFFHLSFLRESQTLQVKVFIELHFRGHGTKYLMLAYLLLSGLFPLLFICTLVNLIAKHFFVFAF